MDFKKVIAVVLILGVAFSFNPMTPTAFAGPRAAGTASALIPGIGQMMNGDHHTGWGKMKIFTMWLVELGAIITTPILGSKHGFPIVMVGVGIFALNHWWSANDAYKGAMEGNGAALEGAKDR